MKKIAFLAATSLILSSSVAWAGAKDKSQNTLVDINATGVIDNTTAKTKTKSKECSLQIQMKDVNLADAAVVICIAEADVVGIGGNSIVLTGEVKKGKLKIKADLGEATFAGLGCGGAVEAVSYNGNLRCFEDDATYRSDGGGAGTWSQACADAGMVASLDGPGATKLKVNDTQSVVVGLCQGFNEGDRIDPPGSQEFARQGQRTPANL
jgi:hypothetical protein